MNRVNYIMEYFGRNDELFRTYIILLLQLKQCSETFQKVQHELRNDYLIRGICEREVDEVIRGSKEYEKYFLPKVLQWNFLKNNPHMIEKVCEDLFAYEVLNHTEIVWRKIINCIESE
ncbi:group-specific protein [Bacillus cereus]|uniref:group-specific protein n=1 Tax=Bacillus paramycoides TaxID=2026194 RepID=UPI000BF9A151|nr:group-specific protein [Bacillus paramycoides]PFD34301.1 group-specific protein [Bacillus cereus]PGM56377.1 group-specific protein [Bacillus cereus]